MDWDSHDSARKFIEGNMKVLRKRNPGMSLDMNNIYAEELEPLPS